MIKPDESVIRALVRLQNDPDFKKFLDWLGEEDVEVAKEWRSSLNQIRVHQLQGAAQLLEDIRQTVTSAPQVAAAINRATT